MDVLTLISSKGGAGKSTIVVHLAVEAEARGVGPVALIDTDPQGTLAGWWNRRKHSETPALLTCTPAEVPEKLDALAQAGFKLALVDTAGRNSPSLADIIGRTTLALIPARPSPNDLDAIGSTVDMVDEVRCSFLFVVNGASPSGANITGEIRSELGGHGAVAPSTLHFRDDYVRPLISGMTAGELRPKGKAAAEITELWTYVATRLARSARMGRKVVAHG